MNKRLRTGALILIPIVLIALFCIVPLAKPEQERPGEDRMVGYYLLPDELVPPDWGTAEGGWEQYPSDIPYAPTDVGGNLILKAQQSKDGEYYFPGVEGRRFFLVWEEELVDGQTDTSVRLCSDLAQGDYIVGVTDQGQSYTVSGTLYYTSPLAQIQEQSWCPYPVFQRPDGTIYLVNSGSHFQGAGAVNFTNTQTETRNGKVIREETVNVTVHFSYVPPLEQVTVTQFTASHQPIQSQTISAQQVLAGEATWELSWAEDAAYALVTEQATDGTFVYNAMTPSEERATHTSYFPTDGGLTLPCSITLP